MTSAVVLDIKDVRKAFGATQALDGVGLQLRRGRVHCLLGGNGSGKSTLIKVLAGVHRADSGSLAFGSEHIDAQSLTPSTARTRGLHFVHQQQSTFSDLSVAENLRIGEGFVTGWAGRIGWRRLRREAQQVLDRFGIDAEPTDQLGQLRPATQAMIAIARALQDQEGESAGVLVLDEPTASLPVQEVELLLAAIKRYAAEGQSILFVTHRLGEVVQVADDVTVFRDGKVVASLKDDEIKHDALVRHIVGRDLDEVLAGVQRHPDAGSVLMEVEGLRVGPLHDATFSLRRGEIVGVAGLLGSGRSTLLQALFGLRRPSAGVLRLNGELLHLRNPRQAMRHRIAFVPEDRLVEAAFTHLDVRENLSIAVAPEFYRKGRMARKAERVEARRLIKELAVKVADIDSPFLSMSGGNQQKIIIGRWIRRDPQILLLDEPTQGVDVGARAEIWRLAREISDGGASVLAVSSDLEELARVSDRVLILRGGRVSAVLEDGELTEDNLNLMLLNPEGNHVDIA